MKDKILAKLASLLTKRIVRSEIYLAKMTVNNLLNACIGAYNDTLININDFDFTMEWVGKRELIPDSIADMSVVAFKVHENNRIDVVIR